MLRSKSRDLTLTKTAMTAMTATLLTHTRSRDKKQKEEDFSFASRPAISLFKDEKEGNTRTPLSPFNYPSEIDSH